MIYTTDTANKVAKDANPEAAMWIRELARQRDSFAAHIHESAMLMQRFFLCDDYSNNGEGEGTSDGVLVPIDLVTELAELSATTPDESMIKLISQRDQLREALKDAMRYFDQVIGETGYQSEGERITHEQARAALRATEEG